MRIIITERDLNELKFAADSLRRYSSRLNNTSMKESSEELYQVMELGRRTGYLDISNGRYSPDTKTIVRAVAKGLTGCEAVSPYIRKHHPLGTLPEGGLAITSRRMPIE